MKITAKSKYNYKTIKNFVRTMSFYKTNPLKKLVIYCLIALLLAAALVLKMYLLGVDTASVIMLVVAALMFLGELFLYFIFPRIRYHSLGQLKGCTNEFIFTDDSVRCTSYDNGFTGESRIDYTVLSRVIETSKYFYIYHARSQALIVDKSTIEGGTPEDLRNKLLPILDKRYALYKY